MANKREKKNEGKKAEVFSELWTLMGIVEDVSEQKKNIVYDIAVQEEAVNDDDTSFFTENDKKGIFFFSFLVCSKNIPNIYIHSTEDKLKKYNK